MGCLRNHSSEFRLTIKGEPKPVSVGVCQELSKLGRKALCNAYRHAKAESIQVLIEFGSNAFKLTIADDGIGMDSTTHAAGKRANHWGLPGIKEKATKLGAQFAMVSDDSSGTTILVTLASRVAYASDHHEHRIPGLRWLFRKPKARTSE